MEPGWCLNFKKFPRDPLRISAFSAFTAYLNAEAAEVRRGSQRKIQSKTPPEPGTSHRRAPGTPPGSPLTRVNTAAAVPRFVERVSHYRYERISHAPA